MNKTSPIKEFEKIQALKNFYLLKKEHRNYVMVTLGLNTALRIGDILKLKRRDVYNFSECKYNRHINIKENKSKNILVLQ